MQRLRDPILNPRTSVYPACNRGGLSLFKACRFEILLAHKGSLLRQSIKTIFGNRFSKEKLYLDLILPQLSLSKPYPTGCCSDAQRPASAQGGKLDFDSIKSMHDRSGDPKQVEQLLQECSKLSEAWSTFEFDTTHMTKLAYSSRNYHRLRKKMQALLPELSSVEDNDNMPLDEN